jgi:hypothetical protein
MIDSIVYAEFKKFLLEYFLGTAYDIIDADLKENEDKD